MFAELKCWDESSGLGGTAVGSMPCDVKPRFESLVGGGGGGGGGAESVGGVGEGVRCSMTSGALRTSYAEEEVTLLAVLVVVELVIVATVGFSMTGFLHTSLHVPHQKVGPNLLPPPVTPPPPSSSFNWTWLGRTPLGHIGRSDDAHAGQ